MRSNLVRSAEHAQFVLFTLCCSPPQVLPALSGHSPSAQSPSRSRARGGRASDLECVRLAGAVGRSVRSQSGSKLKGLTAIYLCVKSLISLKPMESNRQYLLCGPGPTDGDLGDASSPEGTLYVNRRPRCQGKTAVMTCLIPCFGLGMLISSALAQTAFQNLDFELGSLPGTSADVPFSVALPGWTGTFANPSGSYNISIVVFNDTPISSGGVCVFDASYSGYVHGRYCVFLQSGSNYPDLGAGLDQPLAGRLHPCLCKERHLQSVDGRTSAGCGFRKESNSSESDWRSVLWRRNRLRRPNRRTKLYGALPDWRIS